jgi:Fe-S-cluster containining protein
MREHFNCRASDPARSRACRSCVENATSMRPCESCIGECCKHYYVNLNGHDVRRLSVAAGLAPTQFVTLAQESEPSEVGFKLDATRLTFSLMLEKRPGPDGTQQCTFLVNRDDGIGRCGVYEARPAACRAFPAKLHNGSVIFRQNVVCPKGSWEIPDLDLAAWRTVLMRSKMEWAVYGTVVNRWNQEARAIPRGEMRTPEEFFDFLSVRYERIEALERACATRELEAIIDGWGQTSGDGSPCAWERFAGQVSEALGSDGKNGRSPEGD